MKRVLLLILIYVLVVGTAACLFSVSWPWRIELSEIAGQILDNAFGNDGFDPAQFSSDTANPRYVNLQRSLYWMQVSFIGLVFTLLAAFSRRAISTEATINQLTAVLAGIATGKLLIGFPFFDWSALLLWSLAGVLLFALVRAAKAYALQFKSASAARSLRRRS